MQTREIGVTLYRITDADARNGAQGETKAKE